MDKKLPSFGQISKAAYGTFIEPVAENATRGFRQYANMPKTTVQGIGRSFNSRFNIFQNAKNWAYDNPVGSKVYEFAYRLSEQREALTGAYSNPAGYTNPNTSSGSNPAGYTNAAAGPPKTNYSGSTGQQTSNPSSNYNTSHVGGPPTDGATSGDIKDAKNSLRVALISIVDELKGLRKEVDNLTKIADKTSGKLVELVAIMRGDKFKKAEDNIEANKPSNDNSALTETPKKKSWLDKVLGLLQLAGMSFLGSINGVFGRIAGFLKSIKIPKLFEPVIKSLSSFFKGIAEFFKPIMRTTGRLLEPLAKLLEPLAKMMEPLLKFGPRILRFGKAIPIIGEFLLIFMAVIDGIKGFAKGFKDKKGNVLQKTLNGVIEGVKGVIEGLVEPFKLLGEFILTVLDKIPGFKDFRQKVQKEVKQNAIVKGAGNLIESGRNALSNIGQAIDDKLGRVSKKYESGNRGAGAISSGRGDPGGKSYGEYQLSIKAGTLDAYVKQSKYADEFKGLKTGSAEFDAKWKKLASTDPNFAKDQHDFIAKTHYQPALKIAKDLGYDVNDRRIQEAVWSMSVQHSRGGVEKILKDAKQTPGWSSMTSKQMVDAIYKARARYTDATLGKSNPGTARSVRERYERESADLMKLPTSNAQQQSNNLSQGRQVTRNQPTVVAPTTVTNAPTTVNNVNNSGGPVRLPNVPINNDRNGLDSPSRI